MSKATSDETRAKIEELVGILENNLKGYNEKLAKAKQEIYETSEKPLDEKGKGDVNYEYERTDEFRRLQEESKGLSREELQVYRTVGLRGNESKRQVLSNVLQRQMDASSRSGWVGNELSLKSNKNTTFKFYDGVKPQLFHYIFEVARNYLKNGELVDLHDDITQNHGSPEVAFMVNTDEKVETKHFGKDDYDGAKAYLQL